jgi:hypothetical protein
MTKSLKACVVLVFFYAGSLAAQQPPESTAPDAASHVAKASANPAQVGSLGFDGKTRFFADRLFSPWNLVTPALSAGFEMARSDRNSRKNGARARERSAGFTGRGFHLWPASTPLASLAERCCGRTRDIFAQTPTAKARG